MLNVCYACHIREAGLSGFLFITKSCLKNQTSKKFWNVAKVYLSTTRWPQTIYEISRGEFLHFY
jgi:hypothetical protein